MTSNKHVHPNFLAYMRQITTHQNYEEIPFKTKSDGSIVWVAPSSSELGKKRQDWADTKKHAYGIPNGPGSNAKLMYKLHPTKMKPCQLCGLFLSIKYVYPSANFLRKINNLFHADFSTQFDLYEICRSIVNSDEKQKIKSFLRTEFKIQKKDISINELVELCEEKCREGGMRKLGPGVMSNFPDRLDGFHSYNKCCRSTQDKGRHKENMTSYSKDRRAYEYLSDGNIHAANKYMKTGTFTGKSADHIGPISLGFIHDPLYIEPLSTANNSSKRDRLDFETVAKIITIEKATSVCPVSWFAVLIWEALKKEHTESKNTNYEHFRTLFKRNIDIFLKAINTIVTECGDSGRQFIQQKFVVPRLEYFKWNYKFDNSGEIIERKERRETKLSRNEYARLERVILESAAEYSIKENRRIATSPPFPEKLNLVCDTIASQDFSLSMNLLEHYMIIVQKSLLECSPPEK